MANTTDRPRELSVTTRRFDDRHAHVIVRDSGAGIGEENIGRLFTAFFTTKADGVGMGLSICRSLVEAHGGRIWIESSAGNGTVAQFILPVCKPGTGTTARDGTTRP
jgi:signal transduction histidine kinase